MDAGRKVAEVVDFAVRRRILHEGAEVGRVEHGIGPRSGHDFDAKGLRAGAQERDGLRMDVVRDEKLFALAFDPVGHGHGFGGGSRFVEQRGIGDLHAGQVGHHGLEIEQRLEASLGQLRLIRRVGRIPAGIFQDVAQDDRRGVAIAVAHSEVARLRLVSRSEAADFGQGGVLVERGGKVERIAAADGFRNGLVDQRVEAGQAEGSEHAGDFGVIGTDMTADKTGLRGGGLAHGLVGQPICAR